MSLFYLFPFLSLPFIHSFIHSFCFNYAPVKVRLCFAIHSLEKESTKQENKNITAAFKETTRKQKIPIIVVPMHYITCISKYIERPSCTFSLSSYIALRGKYKSVKNSVLLHLIGKIIQSYGNNVLIQRRLSLI